MAGSRDPRPADDKNGRATLKQRAADARAEAAATKAWTTHITGAAVGTPWRVTSSWIEQKDRTHCAELTHVGNGKTRVLRFTGGEATEVVRAAILAAER